MLPTAFNALHSTPSIIPHCCKLWFGLVCFHCFALHWNIKACLSTHLLDTTPIWLQCHCVANLALFQWWVPSFTHTHLHFPCQLASHAPPHPLVTLNVSHPLWCHSNIPLSLFMLCCHLWNLLFVKCRLSIQLYISVHITCYVIGTDHLVWLCPCPSQGFSAPIIPCHAIALSTHTFLAMRLLRFIEPFVCIASICFHSRACAFKLTYSMPCLAIVW